MKAFKIQNTKADFIKKEIEAELLKVVSTEEAHVIARVLMEKFWVNKKRKQKSYIEFKKAA